VAKDQIVIVTRIDDPHADDGILALERQGYEAIRLNTDDVAAHARISMNYGGDRATSPGWHRPATGRPARWPG
jgi:hypothetical protein